jgi:hypothetical protein
VPRFVPLLRHPKCGLIGREVFVKRKLHRGEGVDSIGQATEMVDQQPDGVRHGPGPGRGL